jgi:hypothetical protein
VLLTHLITRLNFFQTFHIPRAAFAAFCVAIEDGYNAVPYHNHLHAFDVTQSTFWLLQQPSMHTRLTNLDVFAAIIAAAIHDFQHPYVMRCDLVACECDV